MQTNTKPKYLLKELFHTAVNAALPENLVRHHIPDPVRGRTIVVGAGKASAAMACAFESAWREADNGPVEGIVVTQFGHETPCKDIEIIQASHPIPDNNGHMAAQRILELAESLGPEDQMIALISGGGSALLPFPPHSIGLKAKQDINSALLKSGATISEMNCVRKHFSLIKGGRLAQAAHPARVISLVLSDVPGDILHQVASGPTLPDTTDVSDAQEILNRYRIKLPDAAVEWLEASPSVAPHPDMDAFKSDISVLLGSAQLSLEAAASLARDRGIRTHILSDSFQGEARDIGLAHAAIVRQVLESNQPFRPPCLLLSGGETTVTLSGRGKGGRNSEFLLAFALGITGLEGVNALAADTDGKDGSEDNAGAFCDGQSVPRMQALGLHPKSMLTNNDAWSAFAALDDLFVSGPTRTNVNDFRAIVISERN